MEKLLKKTKCKIKWFKEMKAGKIEGWLIYFMAVLTGLTYKESLEVAQKFAFSNAHKLKIVSFKKNASVIIKGLKRRKILPSQIYNFLTGKSFEEMILFATLANSSLFCRHVEDYIKIYAKIKTDLTGEDLKKMGLEPSRQLGKILKALLEAKMNGNLKSKEDEVSFCKNSMRYLKNDHRHIKN